MNNQQIADQIAKQMGPIDEKKLRLAASMADSQIKQGEQEARFYQILFWLITISGIIMIIINKPWIIFEAETRNSLLKLLGLSIGITSLFAMFAGGISLKYFLIGVYTFGLIIFMVGIWALYLGN